MVSVDRVGSERSSSFGGLSKIVDTSGEILSLASPNKEEIICGKVNLESARQKRVIIILGKSETDLINNRRPELYEMITKVG